MEAIPDEDKGPYCDVCHKSADPETNPIVVTYNKWICSRCRRTMSAQANPADEKAPTAHDGQPGP